MHSYIMYNIELVVAQCLDVQRNLLFFFEHCQTTNDNQMHPNDPLNARLQPKTLQNSSIVPPKPTPKERPLYNKSTSQQKDEG